MTCPHLVTTKQKGRVFTHPAYLGRNHPTQARRLYHKGNHTMNDESKTTDPYDTLEARTESLAMVKRLQALYPAHVVEQLRGNILKHVADKLEECGFEEDAKLIGNQLFTLTWFSQIHAGGTPTPEQAYEFIRFHGADGLQEDIAKVMIVMADNGRLEAW